LVNRDGLRIILKKSKPERGSGVTSPDLRRAGPENLKNDHVAIVKKIVLARRAKPLRENSRGHRPVCRLPVNPGLNRHAEALIKPLLHWTEPVGRSLCPKQHQPPAAPSEWCCGGDGRGETTPSAHAAANGARSSLAPLLATAAIPPATYHVSIHTTTAGQGSAGG
jgi:hypothetical protein